MKRHELSPCDRKESFLVDVKHDTSHRINVCRPAVRRLRLQAAKSWTEIQNNRYNTRYNAYNSLCSPE